MNSFIHDVGNDPAVSHPFGATATEYDVAFTQTRLGCWLREAVWKLLATVFYPGDHVLELGCGTGEDAIWLAKRGVHVVATDAAPAMLDTTCRKAEAAGVTDCLTFTQLDLTDIGYWISGIGELVQSENPKSEIRNPKFDGAFSNFGAFNCVPDRRPIAEALSRWVRPGGHVVLVVMGPFCPWEIAWHLLHGEVGTAFRRLRSGIEAQIGEGAVVHVWYPSPRRLQAEFAPHFRHLKTVGIGVLLPPSYLSHLVERWPGWFERMAAWDRRLGQVFPWTWLNDHYLVVFERV
jgi:SAM-dependent methyltransferase